MPRLGNGGRGGSRPRRIGAVRGRPLRGGSAASNQKQRGTEKQQHGKVDLSRRERTGPATDLADQDRTDEIAETRDGRDECDAARGGRAGEISRRQSPVGTHRREASRRRQRQEQESQ